MRISQAIESLPACGLLLQTDRETNCQCDDQDEQDCTNYSDSDSPSTPVPYASAPVVPYVPELFSIPVAPYTDAQSTAIGRPLSFNAFARRAQLPSSQD